MRRTVLSVLALLLVSGGLLAAEAPKKRAFSLNAGAQMMIWSDVEASAITLDFRASFRLGPNFELSPEIAFWVGGDTGHSTSDKSRLSPGLMANFVIGHFFLGGGVILPSGFGAKANIGYIFGHVMVTAHFGTAMLSDEQNTIFGINLGYRF
ncbi:MAG: hypothetical protein NTX99_02625 [Candidatus Aminicenantes bacterium]|nr:hypothetical protein [Candidatus Aminicenantes bacterium]